MFVNYLKIAFRNLIKRRVFTAINIGGLATCIAVCLLIGKYIAFETSYDDFHTNGKSIYRVVTSFYSESVTEYDGHDLGPALANSFPEIGEYTRIHDSGSLVSFTDDGKESRYREPNMLFVDNSFFKMFSFRILHGNSTTPLKNTNAIIVTESIAKKYFNSSENAIGRMIRLHDGWTPGLFEITAVAEDVPENSHLHFNMLLPMETLMQHDFYRGGKNERWDNFHTYIQLNDGADIAAMNTKTAPFIQSYVGNSKDVSKASMQFQSLREIHYSPDLNNQRSFLTTIYLFATIALFVLGIAWINYINLATARAVERAREVGVKKAIGASRKQLIVQFFFEAGLVNFFSILLAVGIAQLLLPVLNNITGRSFQFNIADPTWTIALAILFVAGTLISGIYPGIVLSSFKTTEVIKGKITNENGGLSFRNGMVGFQFSCSLLLLVATMVIFRQVNFMQDQDKEFTTEQTIIAKGPELSDEKDAGDRITSFRNELLEYPFVSKVATSFSTPGAGAGVSSGVRKLGKPVTDNTTGNIYWIDPYFIDLYGISVLSGKSWDPNMKTDFDGIVINEEAVKVFGLGDNESAVGQKLVLPFDTARIIGVVKNHHWNSMKQPYTPMIFESGLVLGNAISIQIKGDVHQSLEAIESKFKAAFPNEEFSYYFVDDFYREQYKEEEIFGKLFTSFSVLAIMIACLGLWGLAAFATMRRQKEISIRKTLGASVRSITILLVRQFLQPLLIAGVVIFPLAWIVGENWLQKFPYRIPFSIDLLLTPLAVLLLVALGTVSYQTLRAAKTNPVNALKN